MHGAANCHRLSLGLGIALSLAVAPALAGCDEEEADDAYVCESDRLDWGRGGELMLPGTDCIECHRARASAPDSSFSVAGTVFVTERCPTPVEDVIIHVTDGSERSVELHSNEVGNFFSEERLEPPFLIAVEYDGEVVEMEYEVDSGSCNRCHAQGSDLGFVPIDE